MADFWSMQNGFIIMVVSFILALALAYFAGMMVDQIDDRIVSSGLRDDVPADWEATAGNTNLLINLMYGIIYLIPILGIGVFILTIIRKQQYDDYDGMGY